MLVRVSVWLVLLGTVRVYGDEVVAMSSLECDCRHTSFESVPTACCIPELPTSIATADITFRGIPNTSSIIQLKIHSTANLTDIPVQLIEPFANLQYLELTVGLSHLPTGRRLPTKLKHLNLSDNRITAIDIDAFQTVPDLELINMQFNQIERLPETDTFRNLPKLKHLIFYHNKLTILTGDMFRAAQTLESIDISCNEIETIEDGVFDLPQLKEILMSENRLKVLSDTIFRGATNVQNIDLQKNQLERIGKAFELTVHLHQLQLSENRQLTDLNVMDLASKLPELNSLSVDATGIQTMGTINGGTATTFTFQSPLHTFSLSQNRLAQADFLKQLSVFGKLEKLFVDANHFTRWDEADVKNIKKYFPNIELIVTKSNMWDRRWVENTLIPVFQSNSIFCSNIKYLNTYIEGFTNSIDGQIIEGTECI